nr:MAG TPA: Melon necrotic spot virus P7B protein [Caudoviricetes sp.]
MDFVSPWLPCQRCHPADYTTPIFLLFAGLIKIIANRLRSIPASHPLSPLIIRLTR